MHMKKILLFTFCLLSFAGLNAQTYTSGHLSVVVSDTMYHDSTTCSTTYLCTYTITKDVSFVGDTVLIVDTAFGSLIGYTVNTTGASPWTSSTSPFYIVGTDNIPPGTYAPFTDPVTKVVSGVDTIHYIVHSDSILVTNPCNYGIVSGNVYIDNNSNCTYDAGDVGLVNFGFNITDYLSSPTGSIFYPLGSTGPAGYTYYIQESWMTNFTVSLPPEYAFIFPNSPCFTGYAPFTTLPQLAVDFPLLCTSNVDVECYALAPASVRLHRALIIDPFVNNTGCDTASGQMYFIKDSRTIYDPALTSYPADTVHGDTLIWNYSGLSNLSSGAYWNSFFSDVYLTLDTTVVVGDSLCFHVFTNIPAMDINPGNNDYTVCLPVVYSYDPNVKEVSPKGSGPQGFLPVGADTLTYNVHFQNTGTGYAETVVIIDTLDSDVNPASLKIIGSSHTMTPTWLAPGVVKFSFNNIFLPDSGTNFAGSQGEVRFSVVLDPGLAPGTQILNTAQIYFDANPPVATNTTLNTIPIPTKAPIAVAPAVKVYPNPATDKITVEHLTNGELSILNINGSVIMSRTISNDKTTIDISKLPAGVYVLKTVSDAATSTVKFVKE